MCSDDEMHIWTEIILKLQGKCLPCTIVLQPVNRNIAFNICSLSHILGSLFFSYCSITIQRFHLLFFVFRTTMAQRCSKKYSVIVMPTKVKRVSLSLTGSVERRSTLSSAAQSGRPAKINCMKWLWWCFNRWFTILYDNKSKHCLCSWEYLQLL